MGGPAVSDLLLAIMVSTRWTEDYAGWRGGTTRALDSSFLEATPEAADSQDDRAGAASGAKAAGMIKRPPKMMTLCLIPIDLIASLFPSTDSSADECVAGMTRMTSRDQDRYMIQGPTLRNRRPAPLPCC
jgi:hypothetical protein